MKSFCLIMVKNHPKQQYIILFQEHFISGLYLFQGDRYVIFQISQYFWRALYILVKKESDVVLHRT